MSNKHTSGRKVVQCLHNTYTFALPRKCVKTLQKNVVNGQSQNKHSDRSLSHRRRYNEEN